MISYAAFNARGYTTVLYSIPFYVQPWLTTYVRRKWNSVIKDMIVAVVFIVCLLFAPTLSTGFVALGYVIMLTGYQLIREFSYEPEREMGICIMIINGAFFLFAGLLIILHRQWKFEVLLNLLTVVYALLFLNGMDHMITGELGIGLYGRYADDFYLIHHDKEYLKHCLKYITEFTESLELELNGKTQIVPFKNGISFLGFHHYVTKDGKYIRKIRGEKKRRIRKKVRGWVKQVKSGKLTMEKFNQRYGAWKNHALHGNCIKLCHSMDLYVEGLFKNIG